MIADLLVSLFLITVLAGVGVVIVCAALDCHDRGRARVQRGTSWTSKTSGRRQ